MPKVKTKETKGAAPNAKSTRTKVSITASDQELSYLRELVKSNPVLAPRINVVLASVRGEPIHQIARETGLSRCSVWFWRKRFRDRGVRGLAPKVIIAIAEADRRQLEDLQASQNRKVAVRAKLLLDLARTADVAAAARDAGVRLETARKWRRAFERHGIESLAGRRVQRAMAGLRELTPEERKRLVGWSMVDSNVSQKAAALLALADGEKIPTVAARMDISQYTIRTWRRRFLVRGLSVVNGRSFALTAKQYAGLERLRSSAAPEVAKGAAILLDLARSGNMEETAKDARVCPMTVKRLRLIYERSGEAGLTQTQPKAGPRHKMRRLEVKPSFTAELQLKAEFHQLGAEKPLVFCGQTITISSKYITCVAQGRQTIPATFGGCIVAGEIDWPVTRNSGETVKLLIEGKVVESGPERIRVKLRCGVLRPASETGKPEAHGSSSTGE